MPTINFPPTTTNGQTYTLANGVTYVYSANNNSWTVNTSVASGVNNTVDRDNVIVKLNRVGDEVNALVPAIGFTHDDNGTLQVKGNNTNHIIDIADSSGTILNYFNKSGMLNIAGKAYYQASAPSVSGAAGADYTGCMWIDSDNAELFHWSGSAWVAVGSGVTLSGPQTITGVKTFNADVALSGAAAICGSGESKSIILKPTSSGSIATESFKLTTLKATFAPAVVVAFSAIDTATVSTVLVDKTTNQTVAGIKTFSNQVKINDSIMFNGGAGSNFYITSNSSTSDADDTSNIVIRSNASSLTRYIKLNEKTNTTDGVTINPKNPAGYGRLYVAGSMYVGGNIELSGTVTAAAGFATVSKSMGSLMAKTPTDGNANRVPTPIGPLKFEIWPNTTGNENQGYIRVKNDSTAPVKFYIARQQSLVSGDYIFSERKVTLPAQQYLRIGPSTAFFFEETVNTTGQESILYANSIGAFNLEGSEQRSIGFTFTLAS
jgi:hypothetical protein